MSRGNALLERQLYFECNDGQFDKEVLYAARSPRYSVFLTKSGITVSMNQAQSEEKVPADNPRYFTVRFANTNSIHAATGEEALPGTSNYFSGTDPKQWHTRIPQFAKVRYVNAYPGIDLVFYFKDGHLEYDVIAAPGSAPSRVRFSVENALPRLTRDGDVFLELDAREVVRLRKPHAYQGNGTRDVAAAYSLRGQNFSFNLAKYDGTHPLVIDPALIFSSFVVSNCGGCSDWVNDIAADNTGVYLTGRTSASVFPATATSGVPQNANSNQAFVVKIDPTGSHVLYSTFLASSQGTSISVDVNGSAYVGGASYVPSTPAFPLTSGVFSGTVPANAPAFSVPFATKLSADGSTLTYSTLLQQPTSNGTFASSPFVVNITKIAVDSTGALYVTGTTGIYSAKPIGSVWMALPVTTGAYQTSGTAYVMKLNPTATGLDYATYVDGPNGANGNNGVGGLAIDSSGDAIVAGYTSSTSFPTTSGAYQTSNVSPTGAQAGFVVKMNPSGGAPVYSTYFSTPADGSGQSGGVYVTGAAVDSQGQAVITGSSAGVLPVTSNAFCGNISGANTGFIVKFKPDGSGIVYGSTICGQPEGFEVATSVAVDSTDAIYVAGITDDAASLQSVLLHPIQGYFTNSSTSPVTYVNLALKLDSTGSPIWATLLGQDTIGIVLPGSGQYRIATDNAGDAYVIAYSNIPPTPTSFGPASPTLGQLNDEAAGNFLMKIAPSLGSPVPLANPRQVSFTNQNTGTSSSPVDVQLGNYGDAPMSPVVSITGEFSETDNCSTPVAGGAKCDINVVFTPATTGALTGTLTLTFGGTIPSQTIPLSGNAGAPAVTLSPPLTFGMQANGTTSPAQQVTVTNTGTGSLTISSIQASSQFAATNACGAPLAAGASCTVQVTFTPSASGIQTGTLTVTDNAANSPQTLSLTGNAATTSIGLGVASGGSASATVAAGQTANYALTIGGQGISGSATLNCTGAPTGVSCNVPATATVSATTASKINVSVTTTARSMLPFGIPFIPALWFLAVLACATAYKIASTPTSLRWRVVPLLAIVLCACGGSSNGGSNNAEGTQAGSYTLVVTAKVGSTTQTQNLTLTVQ